MHTVYSILIILSTSPLLEVPFEHLHLLLAISRLFSCVPGDPTPRFVGPLVRRSIGLSDRRSVRPSVMSVKLYCFFVFAVFGHTAPAQMMQRPKKRPQPTRTRLG